MKKNFTYEEIVDILDAEIKKNLENKNKYIALNGYDNTVRKFDCIGGSFAHLLYIFKEEAKAK